MPAPALEDTVDYAARNHVSPEPLAQDPQSLITTRRAAALRGRLSTLICPGTENHPAATVGLKTQWTSQHRDFAGSRGRIGSPVQWVMSCACGSSRLQRGCGVRGWGRDGLGTGARGRGARARRALMSTTRWRRQRTPHCCTSRQRPRAVGRLGRLSQSVPGAPQRVQSGRKRTSTTCP